MTSYMTHYTVNCFWCKKEMNKRKDAYKMEMNKYGHCCCKKCFGNEPTFKAARKRVMTENNPFKGKRHTEETKKHLSDSKKGKPGWNKGLTKHTSASVLNGALKLGITKKGRYTGDKNPNWKGGVAKRYYRPSEGWVNFRKGLIERDCKCWKCESKKRLEVHHLLSRKIFPELDQEEINCILLCHVCHVEFHKRFGRKKFTLLDAVSFLNENRLPSEYVQLEYPYHLALTPLVS